MPRRRSKVLILDGDKAACLALHRALFEGNECFDVLLASTAETAREIMRDITIDVLVSDADLPGSGGVNLVCWAAIEFPEALYIVKTSDDVELLQPQMAGLGCLRLIRKPCAPEEILKIVHEALDCVNRLSGCFSALSAADLIQMLCLAQRTAALRITAGGVTGSVMVKEGHLVHAAWGALVGHDALCEILDAQAGVFRTTPLPDEVQPTIHVGWQQALMEAVHSLDERSSSSRSQTGSFPAIRIDDWGLDKISEPSQADGPGGQHKPFALSAAESRQAARSGGVASSLVDRGFSALRAGNVDEARQFWLAAKKLDPENRSLDLNLKKLESRAGKS
jgi:DNA-binding response OmpR family regulator